MIPKIAKLPTISPGTLRDARLLFVMDIAGTLVFALEGAAAAIRGNLDALGVLVLAFTTALGGGIIRDLLIGAAPPASLRDWRYPATAFAGGAAAFVLYRLGGELHGVTLIALDAAGLALFAMAGTVKALDYEMPAFVAILMGGMTGVGGGTLRDLFLAHVPAVLTSDIYASAALIGAACLVASCRWLRLSPTAAACLGGAVCFVVRVVAVSQHWNLPTALTR